MSNVLKVTQSYAETMLARVLALVCPDARFESALTLKSGPDPSKPATKPWAKITPVEKGSETRFFVQANFNTDPAQGEEAIVLAAAKLKQRAAGLARGPVPEETVAAVRQQYRKLVPEGSDDHRNLLNALAFLVTAFKPKAAPSKLTVTGYLQDGSTVKCAISIKDGDNARRFASLFVRVTATVGDSEIPFEQVMLAHVTATEAVAA